MVRLSFAVRPSERVRAVLAGMPRPPLAGVEWTDPERWIVKLRPLGHVPEELHAPLVDAVAAELDGAPAIHARVGATVRRHGSAQLCAPVDGLDELSAAVFAATEPLVPVTHPQPYHADFVLAGGRVPASVAGAPIGTQWTVRAVLLVADRSSPHGIRLEDVAAVSLGH